MDGNRINDNTGGGFRGNTADFGSSASTMDRGSFGTEQGDISSTQTPGNPHSSSGFRRALMKSQRSQSGTLKGDIASGQHFGGKGFKKPNYFAQGGGRHGMHIGSGAPFTGPAQHEGSDVGGGS